MALQVGDTVRLHEQGVSPVLDGMLALVGAEELFGTEVTVVQETNEYGIAYAAPLPGYEYMGEFPLDAHTTPDATTEEVAA